MGKSDPLMNTCIPTHARCMRANVDAKPCFDKTGVARYMCKAQGPAPAAVAASSDTIEIVDETEVDASR